MAAEMRWINVGMGTMGPGRGRRLLSLPSIATMGCCCSSDYDEDWIENIDICEHCNYPIDPDSKRQVRGSHRTAGVVRDGQALGGTRGCGDCTHGPPFPHNS